MKLLVNVGDEVADGDSLLIVEAMKMETPITCEKGGRIAEIMVSPGQKVDAGTILVAIEEK